MPLLGLCRAGYQKGLICINVPHVPGPNDNACTSYITPILKSYTPEALHSKLCYMQVFPKVGIPPTQMLHSLPGNSQNSASMCFLEITCNSQISKPHPTQCAEPGKRLGPAVEEPSSPDPPHRGLGFTRF